MNPAVRSQSIKRPLNAGDYDSWKSVKDTRLSDDGQWVTYEVNPQGRVPNMVYGNGIPSKDAYDCIVSGVLDLVDRGFVGKNNIGF